MDTNNFQISIMKSDIRKVIVSSAGDDNVDNAWWRTKFDVFGKENWPLPVT